MYRILAFFSSTVFFLLASVDGFCPRAGPLFSHRADTRNVIGYRFCDRVIRERRHPERYIRTRLSESIRENRDKITRATSRLREAVRSEDHELVERLKAYILHLRKRDPQFATQDAMEDALAKGLLSTAAKLKLKLTDINQNPFRQGLLSDIDQDDVTGNSSFSGDVAEDMSWGFDQSFMENDEKGTGLEDEDYDDI